MIILLLLVKLARMFLIRAVQLNTSQNCKRELEKSAFKDTYEQFWEVITDFLSNLLLFFCPKVEERS